MDVKRVGSPTVRVIPRQTSSKCVKLTRASHAPMVPFPYMGVSITKRYPTFLGFEWKRFASDHPPDDIDDGDGELLLDEDLHLAILA